MSFLLSKRALAMAAVGLAGAAHAAGSSCDALMSEIEAKIRVGGVTQFLLTTVDVNAQVEGRVVGTCELGTKKIVYVPAAAGAAAPARPAAKPGEAPILTECKDGSVSMGGDCRKP